MVFKIFGEGEPQIWLLPYVSLWLRACRPNVCNGFTQRLQLAALQATNQHILSLQPSQHRHCKFYNDIAVTIANNRLFIV